jgi:uncharacterized membrane protein
VIKRLGRWAFASLFIVSGILHFVMPKPYIRIVPPMLPRPELLVVISGGAEILGGIGLLIPRLRRPAGYGLALLLVAVFPANIYMAAAHVPANGLLGNRWLQWLRLPVQVPLISCVLHYARAPWSAAISQGNSPEAL